MKTKDENLTGKGSLLLRVEIARKMSFYAEGDFGAIWPSPVALVHEIAQDRQIDLPDEVGKNGAHGALVYHSETRQSGAPLHTLQDRACGDRAVVTR